MKKSKGDDGELGQQIKGNSAVVADETDVHRGELRITPRPYLCTNREVYLFFWYTFSECPPGSKTAVLNWLSTHTKK